MYHQETTYFEQSDFVTEFDIDFDSSWKFSEAGLVWADGQADWRRDRKYDNPIGYVIQKILSME